MNIAAISRAFHKVGRFLKKESPTIAIIAGTAGLVVAGVVACKETPKAVKVIEQHKTNMGYIKEAAEKGEMADGTPMTKEEATKQKIQQTAHDGFELAKIYAPAIIVATVSIVSIFAGGKIFKGRIASLTSAYALLDQRFKDYRKDVAEKLGAEAEKELRYKIKDEVIEETETDAKGKEKTKLKSEKVSGYDGYSDYARFFDESNPHWTKDGARNLAFIEMQQTYANDKLRLEGVLYLNDVYKALGIPRSPQGQLAGWVYDPSRSDIDNFVDFGIKPILRDKSKFYQVMRNEERNFLLDFNCDGRIVEQMLKYEKV